MMRWIIGLIVVLAIGVYFVDACGHKKVDIVPVFEKQEYVLEYDHCRDRCGDGFCNEYRCLERWGKECKDWNRGCTETPENCPQDC